MPAHSPPTEDTRVVDGDEELTVATEERTRGSAAPFYAVYRGSDPSRRYGWLCANCESVATAMDPMGRIECTDCDNRRPATRWDAGYL